MALAVAGDLTLGAIIVIDAILVVGLLTGVIHR